MNRFQSVCVLATCLLFPSGLAAQTNLADLARVQLGDLEFGFDQGFVMRSGYSRLDYLRESLVYLKSGILAGYNFQRQAFDLVPSFLVGWQPLFAGLRYSLFEGPDPTRLEYEWGASLFPFQGKVVTADFRNYSFYLGFTLVAPSGS